MTPSPGIREALEEAINQTIYGDELDESTIGPAHWLHQARRALASPPTAPEGSADSPERVATEYGWLIENGKQAGAGLAYRFIDNDAGGIPGWTPEHNLALRFARRSDAEQYAYHDEDAWRIVEHAWDAQPGATAPAPEPLTDEDRRDIEEAMPKMGEPENAWVMVRGFTLRRLAALAAVPPKEES